jgi:hypothetical protein
MMSFPGIRREAHHNPLKTITMYFQPPARKGNALALIQLGLAEPD